MDRFGVPQVILPAGLHCFENATRAEFFGVGVYGNKRFAPHIGTQELASSLHAVLEQDTYRHKARKYSEISIRNEGRTLAANRIVELALSSSIPAKHVLKPLTTSGSRQFQTQLRNVFAFPGM